MTAEIISGTDAWRSKRGLSLFRPGTTRAPGRGELLSEYLKRRSLSPAIASPWPTVSIIDNVRNSLDDLFDGGEVGGYLFGPTGSSEDEIHITHAFVANGDRTATSVVLDLDKGLRIWNDLPPDLTIRGDFHAHPNDDQAKPSSNDLRSWENSAQVFERPWVGLIGCNSRALVFGRETGRFEISATVARFENGRASHRNIEIETRSY
jgi:hypothetical protein